MWLVDKRAQVLANCKCLCGPDIDVITLSYGGNLHQAVAMKFDPFTASWTSVLHSTGEASSTDCAISSLLHETETKIANLFSTNGLSVPLSGDPMQTMTLQRVRGHSAASSSGGSQSSSLEFIATPDSKSENGIVLEEVPCAPCEESKVEAVPPITGGSGFEFIEEVTSVEELRVAELELQPELEFQLELEPQPEPEPVHVDEWMNWGFGKKNKKKKGYTTVEEPEPQPEPEPELVDDSGWGSFATSKKNKKKKSRVVFETPIVEDTPLPDPEPEPEAAPVDDDIWGTWGTVKKDKKKKSRVVFETPTVEDTPLPDPEPEPAPVEDDWGTWGTVKKDKKKKPRVIIKEPIVEDIPPPDPELEPAPVEDDGLGIGASRKDEKNKEQSIVEDVLRTKATANELHVETPEATPAIKAAILSTTTESLPQTALTNITSQSPVVKTVVLKIVHTSKAGTQTLQTMVNLAANTKKAIFDAVNQYLDYSSDMRYLSSCRIIEIKSGSGKNGDLDLSALEEGRWPEYLEYLSQYTRFPELTVHASD